MDDIHSIIRKHLKGAVRDGMVLGAEMAIDSLKAAQPHVATENQTWDSAIAVLSQMKTDYEKRSADD